MTNTHDKQFGKQQTNTPPMQPPIPDLLIGLTGPIGSGKSTFAKAIAAAFGNRVSLRPFAAPLKDFAMALGWDGQKDAKGRRLLQLLGTDCGRECIHPDIWVRQWRANIAHAVWPIVIADDVRFPNEAKAIHELGGTIVQLQRPDQPTLVHAHASEAGIPEELVDIVLPIHDGIHAIQQAASVLAHRLGEPH